MATSAPASFHALVLPASRNTTRTFFFCASSVSATTLPVFPEAPSTISIGGLPGFARLQSQREGATFALVCQIDVVHAMDAVHPGTFGLNVLVALEPLLTERGTTRAAGRIGSVRRGRPS